MSQTPQQLVAGIMVDDRFADHSAEPRHPVGEPPWNLPATQRQISASSSLSHPSDPPRSLDHLMLSLQYLRSNHHCRSQAWNRASLQGSESSAMWSFMQALMRPCPGGTSPQNCLMSGLHALAAAIAPGRICAIAPDAESSKMAQIVRTRFIIV
jgi:hypothetical protein